MININIEQRNKNNFIDSAIEKKTSYGEKQSMKIIYVEIEKKINSDFQSIFNIPPKIQNLSIDYDVSNSLFDFKIYNHF